MIAPKQGLVKLMDIGVMIKNRKTIIFAIVAVLIVAIATIATIMIINSNSNKSSSSNTNSSISNKSIATLRTEADAARQASNISLEKALLLEAQKKLKNERQVCV